MQVIRPYRMGRSPAFLDNSATAYLFFSLHSTASSGRLRSHATYNHIACAQVTDPYQLSGSGATTTANIDNESVGSISVTNEGSDYPFDSTLPADISGGGGTGAIARTSIGILSTIYSVTVIYGGTGYTSAPSVEFPTSARWRKAWPTSAPQPNDLGTIILA